MTSPRRLAVLHDSPDFGGHERAFMTWLPALLKSARIAEVHMHVPAANTVFLEALRGVANPKLNLTLSRYVKSRGEPYRAPLRIAYGRHVAAFLKRTGADLVLLLHGRIENLATPMLWLPRTLEVVSYLPMAHSGVEMGRAPALARFTDTVKRFYYARPQRMIVPSHAVAAQARRAGRGGATHVVENVPAASAGRRMDRDAARALLGLEGETRIALFMGRFDTHQKGLDRLLQELHRAASGLADWRFLFVGQGPAEPQIRAVLKAAGVRGEIVGWTADPDAYLAAADVLMTPSRFEGVPLVMLEALQRGLPILASDIDVYREYLPASALFDFDRPVELADALQALTRPGQLEAYGRHAGEITGRLDLHTSQERFVSAVLGEPVREGLAPDIDRLGAAGQASIQRARS